MKRLKKIIPLFVMSLIATVLLSSAVYASTWEYRYPIIITDTSEADRTYVPVVLGFGGQNLVNANKINANGLDTNMQIGVSDTDYMMSTTEVTTVVPSLPAGGKVQLDLYTGYSPEQTSFPIVVGLGGYVTTSDNASLEWGSDGGAEITGYFNPTSTGNITAKDGAYQVYGNGDGTVTLTLPVSPFVDTTGFTNINDRISNTNGVYATCHNAATGTVGDSLTVGQIPGFSIYRGFVAFDTSSIPASATIQTAILSLDGATNASVTDFDVVVTYNGTLPHDPLAAGDFLYSQYTGNGGSFNTSTWSDSSNNITLNATGISWINKGGQTRLAIQSSRDISSTPPAKNEYVIFDETLTTLTIVYTINLTTAAVSAGEHTFNAYLTGGNLGIQVDGGAPVTTAYAGSITDNANPIYFATNNIMSYCDNISMTISGVEQLLYAPTSMLSGTTLEDLVGANDGTITWGSNSNLTISFGTPESYESYVATANITSGFTMPSAAMPSTWFSAGEGIASLPFYDMINQAATNAGIPAKTIYAWIIVGLAFCAFVSVIMYTGSDFMAVLAMSIVFFIGSSMTIVPMWIPFVILITDFGIMYLVKQVSY